MFTLVLLVVIRIGAAITCPGVNAAVIQTWFNSQVNNDTTGNVAALFNIFSGGALENCAVFSLGVMPYISASIMLQLLTAVVPQLSKLSKEDGGRQKIMQYTRYATITLCVFQGYLLALSFENPGSNPFLHGIMDTIKNMGIPLVADPGFTFRIHDGDHAYRRHDVPHVAGRPDYRPGHRQRHVAHHFRRHRGPPASRANSGLAHLRSFRWSGFEPGQSDVPRGHDRLPHHRDRGRHLRDPGAAKNQRLLRQARGRAEGLWWPDAVHAAQGQLRGSHADHLRPGAPHLPVDHRLDGFQLHGDGAEDRRDAHARLVALSALRLDDFLLQLLLGGHAVPAAADRGGFEEVRRLCPGRASRQADGGLPRFHDDAADFRRRHLPDDHRHSTRDAFRAHERALHHRAILRRHQPAHRRGRRPRYDAPGGDPSYPAALRRLPAQGAHPGPLRNGAPSGSGEAVKENALLWMYVIAAVVFIAGMAIIIAKRLH